MNNEKSLFTIYNQRLAGYLMLNGFPLVMMNKNNKTQMNIFVFPNTQKLQDYIAKWKVEWSK